jgi:uncharacterized membrane protein
MANKMMHGNVLIFVGLLLLLDAFVTIQTMLGFATISFFNGAEFVIGLIVIYLGFKAREMK